MRLKRALVIVVVRCGGALTREKERERLVKRLLKTKKRISMKLAMLLVVVVAMVVTGEQWYSAAVDTSSPSFPLRRRWW